MPENTETIADAVDADVSPPQNQGEPPAGGGGVEADTGETTASVKTGGSTILPEWLTYETGDKALSYYREHAVNFNGSQWFGRILRGVDGLTRGKLKNYWFFDIAVGAYQGLTQYGNDRENEIEEIVAEGERDEGDSTPE